MRNLFVKVGTIILVLCIGLSVSSQTIGDYRSKITGNWSSSLSWERFNGTNWATAVSAPGSSDGVITIKSLHIITVDIPNIHTDQTVVESGAELRISLGQFEQFLLNNGTGDDILVNGTMTWNGGGIYKEGGASTITIASGGLMTINSSGTKVLDPGLTITANATMTWNSSDISLPGSITNNGVINIAGNNSLTTPGNQPLNNNGTITKTSNGASTSSATINNAGTINLNSGTLSSGIFNSNTNGVLNFSGGAGFINTGQFIYNAGTVQGTGNFTNNNSMTLNAALVFPATVFFTHNNPGAISGTGNLTINNDFTLQSTIDGIGSTLIINANTNWQSAALYRSLTIGSGRTLTLNTAATKELYNTAVITIANGGTLNWNDGLFRLGSSAGVTNNGTINIAGNNQFLDNSSTCNLVNNHIISKTSTGTTQFSSIDFTNTVTGIIKGVGIIDFNTPAHRYHNNGTIAPGLSPGILTVNSSLNLINPFGATSNLQIEIAGNGGAGTANGHDQLQRNGNLTLNGTLTVVETETVPGGDYIIISLTSGTITGTFSTTNLPAFYSVVYNSNNVLVRKEGFNIYYRDSDGDGFGDPGNTIQGASPPAGYITDNTDCNDNSAAIHPGATEVCNGIDDDCDGLIDEGVSLYTWCRDTDSDGYGTTQNTILGCLSPAPAGYVLIQGDCNDNNAAIHPNATEVCNGADDDCDGQIDEGVLPGVSWYPDADGDGYGRTQDGIPGCLGWGPTGYVLLPGDCNDNNAAVHPGVPDICNGIDDNCNGMIDEGDDQDNDGYTTCEGDCDDNNAAINPNTHWYLDADNDNYFTGSAVIQCASPGSGYKLVTGLLGGNDCNDNNAAVHPFATEVCNGIDDDCDGQIDEGVGNTYLPDTDGDGYGHLLAGSIVYACSAPSGYVLFGPANPPDCNDNNPNIHPFATEICNGIDDDCDGQIDKGLPLFAWYPDIDSDGYGRQQAALMACSAPAGYVIMDINHPFDCNDNNAAIHPFAAEICNGVDDNCNGQIDEGLPLFSWFPDTDGDGYGRQQAALMACSAPAGYVVMDINHPFDCNDNNAAIHPNATEICNGIDDDCDGQIDEGILLTTPIITPGGLINFCQGGNVNLTSSAANGNQWYKDGIAIGGAAAQILNVTTSGSYTAKVTVNGCTSATSAATFAMANPVMTYYRDMDADGYGRPNVTIQACSQPAGFVSNSTDCNDNNSAIHPGAVEICNGIDDNCNGQIDEGVQIAQATITPGGVVITCSGSTIILTASPLNANYRYQWFRDGVLIYTQTYYYQISTSTSGIYTVKISAGNCTSTSLPAVIINLPAPSATISVTGNTNICNTGSVQLAANAGILLKYQWRKNGAPIAGATQRIYTATQIGNYSVTVTNILGCSKTSSAVTVTNSCQAPITQNKNAEVQEENIPFSESLTIYPNPASDQFRVKMNFKDGKTGEAVIEVRNLSGKTVLLQKATVFKGRLQVPVQLGSQYTNGLYIVRVIFNNEAYATKLIKN